MPPLADIQAQLASLSIAGHDAILSHAAAANPADYKTAVSAAHTGPAAFIKTLVFKPKGKPTPLVVIASEATETSSGPLGKKIGLKDLRLAAADVLQETFGATKDDVSPLSINKANAEKIVVALDASLAASSDKQAVHAGSSDKTLLLSGQDIAKYLESTGTKVEIIDFAALKAETATAPAAAPKKSAAPKKTDAKIEDAELIGITVRKEGDFSDWYQQVLRKGDMIDFYNVSGCYVIKPWSYFVWGCIQEFFDAEIKKLGVEGCYFPMFVSADVLEREKDHVEGFAPEVAWVTRAGKSELERPVAIRPTSETVMYPYYAKWITSHRDLPLKLNQWNSVVRWEFKHPQPFLRTREFLWQEGHTAFLTRKESEEEVYTILDLYAKVYTDLLAVPVVPGVKSEKEKFAGGLFTTTVEGFVPSVGRGIQGGTSHCLGQNFSKMFDISVEDPTADDSVRGKPEGRTFVWQNSWGLSTRTLGVMVMVHGDDKGLVMPPRVSKIQVVIIPVGITVKTGSAERKEIHDACDKLWQQLKAVGIRVEFDNRENYSPAWKFNDWELRGVPVRLELGPQDLKKNSVLSARRDTFKKAPLPLEGIEKSVTSLLETIQSDMYKKAETEYAAHRKVCTNWDDFTTLLNGKNHVIIPWCEDGECEDAIKDRSARTVETEGEVDDRAPSMGAKSLCIPNDQAAYPSIEGKVCPQCGKKASVWTMFGRSY